MGKVKELNDKNFNESISGKVALIDFWSSWCNPCKMIAPIIDELADELGDRAFVGKVNIEDDADSVVGKYKVMSLPTILIFDDLKVIQQYVGVQKKETLIKTINEICNKKKEDNK